METAFLLGITWEDEGLEIQVTPGKDSDCTQEKKCSQLGQSSVGIIFLGKWWIPQHWALKICLNRVLGYLVWTVLLLRKGGPDFPWDRFQPGVLWFCDWIGSGYCSCDDTPFVEYCLIQQFCVPRSNNLCGCSYVIKTVFTCRLFVGLGKFQCACIHKCQTVLVVY